MIKEKTNHKQSHIYTRCIVVLHNNLHPLLKAQYELYNFIKIEGSTIKDKINKILVHLPSKQHPMSLASVIYGLLFRGFRPKRFGYTLPVSLTIVSILPVSLVGDV